MSFRDKVTLSMQATDGKFGYESTIPDIEKQNIKILPSAVIYGGNASGKSNLIKALKFMKTFITNRRPKINAQIPLCPFRLSKINILKPSCFESEVIVDNDLYQFSFLVSPSAVINEKLIVCRNGSDGIVLYDRDENGQFSGSCSDDQKIKTIAETTSKNELFLTNFAFSNLELFKPLFNWFDNSLEFVSPNSTYEKYPQYDEEFYKKLNNKINHLLPHISHLDTKDVDLHNFSPSLIDNLLKHPEDIVRFHIDGEFYIGFKNESGLSGLTVKKFAPIRFDEDGDSVEFKPSEESEGYKRIINLLPAFMELEKTNSLKVYFFDELDRSLHHKLTRDLIGLFLHTCSTKSRAQLVFTTHDLLFLDCDLFRNDEIFLVDRGADGVSTLSSLSDFELEDLDQNKIKSYLQGRFGGVPNNNIELSR